MLTVPANDFRGQWEDTREDTLQALEAVGASGWYILGGEVRAFETELAAAWGLPHAVGVGSGLDALELSLRALGCRAGDEVLTTPLSAFATTLAIVKTGATPIFCDVDGFGLIDLDLCERVIRNRGIRFFVPVHLYGHSLDTSRLQDLRRRYEITLVEDCAQSILADHSGSPTGTAGDAAATSFYPTKNLGAIGDGGAVLTASLELANRIRCLRDSGQSAKYRHEVIGFNSRLDELHAAILRYAHLPRLRRWTARRRHIAAAYLSNIRNRAIEIPSAPPGSGSCWHLFPVLTAPERKSDFLSHLQSFGIGAGEHYPSLAPAQPALAAVEHHVTDSLENAYRFCRSEVSLPIHPYLTDAQVTAVIDACNTWRS